MKSFTQKGVNESLRDSVEKKCGNIDYQKENETSDWFRPDDPYWYFAIVPVVEFKWGLFVKFKLLWEEGDEDDEAIVEIVSIHEEKKV
jgi:hypothetical protein